ncbi:calcium-dependent protein kinase 20 [Artemisia annua]|uniref:Calcium-dependent protein kinase 20 n=1 Tax=Artemisia annua TaxID=35608 RepID=A0A2U1NBJ8_ARTAN|nr:calcium-dependent protein kinase 20 [Artemisia annua]
MGNNCVGPTVGKTGFLQSVTAAVWRNRPPENLPPPNSTTETSTKDTVKMTAEPEAKTSENVKVAEVKVKEKENGAEDNVKETKSGSKFKRVQSMGQQNSVLGRKTGNIKEVYSMGKKLGQGQFGTTFLCVEKETGKEFAWVMHRDLKPENFLFINEQEEAPLKTIDFGLSMFFKPGEMFTDMVGSPYYVAPEVLRKFYSQECDIWSAGVIIYILLSGVPPFWDETEQGIFEQVLKGDLDFASEPWPSISESAKDLVRKMLVRDPKRRLTAPEVLQHPWVQANGVAPDKPLDSAVLSRLKQFSAMNKIKKIAIRVIAETLSEEEIAGLKEMFKMIDADGSGQITLEELKKGLEKVGANIKDSEIVHLMEAHDCIFAYQFTGHLLGAKSIMLLYLCAHVYSLTFQADIDNSGTIDYGEFVAAMLHINKVHKEDHMYAAFSYFDKDGSGYITSDELQQACEKFGLGDMHLEDVMRDIDKDNDGRIDYSEFVAMMKEGDFGKNISLRLR